jgi:membrane associated rhomboid family serine protease
VTAPGSATLALIIINVLVFLWVTVTGGGFGYFVSGGDNQLLYDHGALYGPAVTQGEWWRIISSGFLHAGILHIGLNMFALYQVGTFLELVLRSRRMLMLYFISLVGSGLCVVWFSYNEVTVGASGAIFGLFGALAVVGLRLGPQGRALLGQLIPIIVLNLIFTFSVPGISAAGHVGGLVTGFLAALVIAQIPRRPVAATAPIEYGDAIETVPGTEEEETAIEHDGHAEP